MGDTFSRLQQDKRALFPAPAAPNSAIAPNSISYNPLDRSPIAWSVVAPSASGLPSQQHPPASNGAPAADHGRSPDAEWREALAAVRAASVALVAERQELRALRSQAMVEEDEILAAVQATRDELRSLARVRFAHTTPRALPRLIRHSPPSTVIACDSHHLPGRLRAAGMHGMRRGPPRAVRPGGQTRRAARIHGGVQAGCRRVGG
jgi:hypothetical protein